MQIRHFVTQRVPQAALGMLLTITGGLSAPMQVQTTISVAAVVVAASAFDPASAAPAAAATTGGTAELSPAPPNLTQAVPPNIVLTFDDSGSMQANHLSDFPPYTTNNDGSQKSGLPDFSGGPWRCANVIDADHLSASDGAMLAPHPETASVCAHHRIW